MQLPAPFGEDSGFTLIEFVVAVFIMSIGVLALLQTVNLSISANASNKKRNEAVVIADQMMGAVKVLPFNAASLNPSTSTGFIKTSNAGLVFTNYSVVQQVGPLMGTTKNVMITVSWRDKQVKKNHSLSTLISQ